MSFRSKLSFVWPSNGRSASQRCRAKPVIEFACIPPPWELLLQTENEG